MIFDAVAGQPAAVQARSRASLDSASARQRSNVGAEMQSSHATVSSEALSGGNNRATALSLKACPYLATSFFHYRPLVGDSNEATTILSQGKTALMNSGNLCGRIARFGALVAITCHMAAGGVAVAHDDTPSATSSANVRRLLATDLPDMAGKHATMITVDYAPGQASAPHFHPGSVFAYVLQGSIESQLGSENPVTYTKGQFWYEIPKQIHRVSRNTSTTEPARLLVILLSDKDEQLVVPIK